MLDEVHYASVLNFFYFLLLDEGLALSAAYKTVRIAQKRMKKRLDKSASESVDLVLMGSMSDVLKKYRQRKKSMTLRPPRSQWTGVNNESLGAWKDYMRHGDGECGEILVLHYILGYPVKAISNALNIPEGTVYFRLGRGLESFARGSLK